MKKWLLWFLAFVILFALSTYIFVPAKVNVIDSVQVKANSKGLFRCLQNTENWQRIVGTASVSQANGFAYDGFSFNIERSIFENIFISIKGENITLNSSLKCFQAGNDSAVITWSADTETTNNPFTKLTQYLKAQKLKTTTADILAKVKTFAEREENLYGITVTQKQVVDTLLISTKRYFKTYPSDTSVNEMISVLKKYIAAKDIKQTNPPMLNVRVAADKSFETMVALPVDKEISDEGSIVFKRMIPGKILVTEIKGGTNSIKQAFATMDLYLQDHQYVSPAIPFESMITDRMQENDTSKWLTKIYYPIY
jgi:effector-binding domain-containing protein